MTNLYNDGAPNIAGSGARSNLTAFFDNKADADAAVAKLKSAGISDVRLMLGSESGGDGRKAAAEEPIWSRLGDWLFPDNDRHLYAEGLRRGGFLVSVSVNASNYDTAHDILDDNGAIDLDERADLWRTEGWNATRDQQAAASRDDVFQADAAGGAKSSSRYRRTTESTSPRVRGYELTEELPEDVVDDIIPTGHQRDVSEGARPTEDRMTQSQSIDDMRQSQILPASR